MDYRIILLITFAAAAVGEYTCSNAGCHECIGETCNLSCRGETCSDCPDGSCCDSSDCNVCVASVCCSTPKCNRCVNKQRKLCPAELSWSECSSLVAKKCELDPEQPVYEGGNFNANRHPNVTTIIRIRNLINNTNIVDVPIELNITNTNDMVVNQTRLSLQSLEGIRRQCCFVVHPEECHQVPDTKDVICFTRRHRECSALCNNSTSILIKVSHTKREHCINVAVYPFYYCGYYALEDCSGCYNCIDVSKVECLEKYTCSGTCRSSILPRRFYNAPYRKKNTTESE